MTLLEQDSGDRKALGRDREAGPPKDHRDGNRIWAYVSALVLSAGLLVQTTFIYFITHVSISALDIKFVSYK